MPGHLLPLKRPIELFDSNRLLHCLGHPENLALLLQFAFPRQNCECQPNPLPRVFRLVT